MAKSWLDCQVDVELTNFQQGRPEDKQYGDGIGTPSQGNQSLLSSGGPETWPCHVLDQQPHDLTALLQKLHSRYWSFYILMVLPNYMSTYWFSSLASEIVSEVVSRACKEQHRQIEVSTLGGGGCENIVFF